MVQRIDMFAGAFLALAIAAFGLVSFDKQAIFLNDMNLCGIYCQMATHYGEMLFSQSFDKYYFQKSLLSFLTYAMMTVGGLSLTPQNANYINEVLSLFLLCGASIFWYRAAHVANFTRSAYWVGLIGMMGCHLFTKLVPYAQESPDTAAFFLGMAALYVIVSGRIHWILAIYALSMFEQPQLKIFLAPVFILWYQESVKLKETHILSRLGHYIENTANSCGRMGTNGIKFLIPLYIFIFAIAAYIFPLVKAPMHGTENSLFYLFPVSILLAAIVFAVILRGIRVFDIIARVAQKLPDVVFWQRFGIILAIELAGKAIVSYAAQGEVMSATSSLKGSIYAFASFYYQAVEQPLKFLSAPITFYGPIFALIVLSFRHMLGTLATERNALAISCALILFILLFPDTESRHFIAFIPWFAYLALKGRTFTHTYVIVFTIATILTSRFYAAYAPVTPDNDPFLMTWGPWYTPEIYVKSMILSAILLIAFWRFGIKWGKPHGY